ncbi:MAG: OmpA family protein [Thermonemataceae bacterium]|nr:OmpA family protein [Thermonemataceae bacterium]
MKVLKVFMLSLLVLAMLANEADAQKRRGKKVANPRKVTVPAAYKVDTDNDKIPDVRDQCPNTPAKEEVNDYGCPKDFDNDGVPNKDDKCPGVEGNAEENVAAMGPKDNEGCPWGDKDGDGFLDNADKCPDIAGVQQFFGCPAPDFDQDGVPDDKDDCYDKKGPKSNKGCPENKDSDGDGLLDQDDACPDKPGPRETKGCPKLTNDADEAILRQASKVEFESGKATIAVKLQKKWYPILDKVVTLMKKYPDAYMLIEGHTDNVKPKVSAFKDNQQLSEARAKFIMDYLVSKGISANKLKAVGYGDTRPYGEEEAGYKTGDPQIKEANKTAAQKAQNRRVKMTITSTKIW